MTNKIKIVLWDADGVVNHWPIYFSKFYSQKFDVPYAKMLQFFNNEFQLCLIGKADLKQELTPYLKAWKWQKSVDELVLFWFKYDTNIDQKILQEVKTLRKIGIRSYLHTNNEQYRAQYLFETSDLKKHFDGAFSSAKIGFLKPQQEFWSAIYNQLKKPQKSEVLVWDDHQENVKSAKDFGFCAEFYSSFNDYKKRMELYYSNNKSKTLLDRLHQKDLRSTVLK